MTKTSITLIALLGLILICNIPPINMLLSLDDCRYSNNTGSFTFAEINIGGYDYNLCMNRFTDYKDQVRTDTILYRLTAMNPLCFWKYRNYLFDKKYRLPYKSWKDVEQTRGPIKNKSGFQDF
jgi:hypothetical protein